MLPHKSAGLRGKNAKIASGTWRRRPREKRWRVAHGAAAGARCESLSRGYSDGDSNFMVGELSWTDRQIADGAGNGRRVGMESLHVLDHSYDAIGQPDQGAVLRNRSHVRERRRHVGKRVTSNE